MRVRRPVGTLNVRVRADCDYYPMYSCGPICGSEEGCDAMRYADAGLRQGGERDIVMYVTGLICCVHVSG